MSTWYIQRDNLVRAGWGQKYIDKVRTAAGNWRYIYEEDVKPKASQAASTAKQVAKNAYNAGKQAIHDARDKYKTQQNAKRIRENAAANREKSNSDLDFAIVNKNINKNLDLAKAKEWKKADADKRFQEHLSSKRSQEKDERVLAGKKRYAEAASAAKKYAGQQKATASRDARHEKSEYDAKAASSYKKGNRDVKARQTADFESSAPDSKAAKMLKTGDRNKRKLDKAAAEFNKNAKASAAYANRDSKVSNGGSGSNGSSKPNRQYKTSVNENSLVLNNAERGESRRSQYDSMSGKRESSRIRAAKNEKILSNKRRQEERANAAQEESRKRSEAKARKSRKDSLIGNTKRRSR